MEPFISFSARCVLGWGASHYSRMITFTARGVACYYFITLLVHDERVALPPAEKYDSSFFGTLFARPSRQPQFCQQQVSMLLEAAVDEGNFTE